MEAILGIIHGIDYSLNFCLLGVTTFYYLILPAGQKQALKFFLNWPLKFRVLSAMTLFSSLLWMILVAHDMADSWSPQEIWNAISLTTFGHLWCLKIVLLIIANFLIEKVHRLPYGYFLILAFMTMLPLFFVFTGHGFSQAEDRFLRLPLDWIHSVSVGIWSGGLYGLYIWLSNFLKHPEPSSKMSYDVVKRFSHFAMASTAAIFVSGMGIAYLSGIDLQHPLATIYGQLVFAKIFTFCGALGIASINQFVHLKSAQKIQGPRFAKSIRREIVFELAFIIVIFILAGFLSRTPPPGS